MKLRRAATTRNRRSRQAADDLPPSSASFSYSARRSEETRQMGRQADRQSNPGHSAAFGRLWLQRFGLIILLAAAVASIINVLSLSADAKVLPLTAGAGSPSLLRPTGVYEAAASHQLGSSIWNRNKITVDTAQVSHKLLSQFSELSSVTVTLPLLAHRPVVYIQPAQPALILVTPQGQAFVLDTRGKVLLKGANPAVFNQPNLPVISDQSGLGLALNKQGLSAANVQFVQTVAAQLTAKQMAIAGMTLPAATSELDVQLTGQPYFVKFNLQSNNPRGETGTLLATIAQLSRQNTVPAHYIDVRVDGRAYYQ
jgi:hypothetical protein